MSEIDIEIDVLTPCLLRTRDNIQVPTSYTEHQGDFLVWDRGLDFDITEYESADEYGFVETDYDLPRWSWEEERNMFPQARFFELFANGDNRPQGRLCLNGNRVELVEAAPWNNVRWLREYVHSSEEKEFLGVGGHLLAIAVNELYTSGSNGELFFRSVDGLQEHYIEALGASCILAGDGQDMVLSAEAAHALWAIYFEDDYYVR